MKKVLLSFFLIYTFAELFQLPAQIPVGTWRDHLSYHTATGIAEINGKIICSTPSALFEYNPDDNSINKLSRSKGLSDVGVSTIAYDADNGFLVVAYENANIDLIKGKSIYNLGDIKNKQIQGDKKVYHITFHEKLAYLACGFGIVVIDLEKNEVKETYYIGANASAIDVYSICFDSEYIYAATGSGIYKALASNPILIDYKQWEKISSLPYLNAKYTHLVNFNSEIFASYENPSDGNSTIYRQTADNWVEFYSPGKKVKNFRVFNNQLFVIQNNATSIFNTALIKDQEMTSYGFDNTSPNDLCITGTGKMYVADNNYGLVAQRSDNGYESIIPNGPYTNHVADIAALNNQVCVVGGGHTSYGANLYNFGELYTFSNESWNSNIVWDENSRDFSSVLINPSNPQQVFIGAWGSGVYLFENGKLTTIFNEQNSTLQSIFPGENYIRIAGLALDQSQNLYVTNQGVTSPVSVKTADGIWHKFRFSQLSRLDEVAEIIITQNDTKWVLLSRGGGLFAFNDNHTPADSTDDQTKRFSIYDETGQFQTNEVYSIAEDDNGIIWVGTDIGVFTYYNPEYVFSDEGFYASRVKVPDPTNPGYAQYLLAKERINAIAVDGANRKWIGTENSGVYLLSDDCENEIFHFTKENSKLLSNNVVSIAIEPKSGEVFFGTGKGVVSYKSTATEGDFAYKDAYVYPNPVRQNYEGLITITGLAANVDVKITDIAGQLVYQTKAFGGQAIWNGKNHSGQKVKTGVYLIFCTDDLGEKTKVLKLLFIN